MSNIGATLAKPVGPMPLGAWLLVGAGGLWVASRKAKTPEDTGPMIDPGDALPTGGGLGPTAGGVQSFDGAPVILQPIFNITTPTPTTLPTPPVVQPPVPPRVPAPTGTTPRPLPKPPAQVITHTIKRGDTLSGIAKKYLGSYSKWPSIYAQNKAVIDAKAKAMGKPGGGHWIYPGTVLRFTK